MTARQLRAAKKRLRRMFRQHDRLERDTLVLLRKFSDAQIRKMGLAAGG